MVLAGCASSVSAVTGAVDSAPAWFEDARGEIRGQDYPEVASIPDVPAKSRPVISAGAALASVSSAAGAFLSDDRAQSVPYQPEQILAWAAEKRAVFNDIPPLVPGSIDTSAAKAFDVPRAQLPNSRTKR